MFIIFAFYSLASLLSPGTPASALPSPPLPIFVLSASTQPAPHAVVKSMLQLRGGSAPPSSFSGPSHSLTKIKQTNLLAVKSQNMLSGYDVAAFKRISCSAWIAPAQFGQARLGARVRPGCCVQMSIAQEPVYDTNPSKSSKRRKREVFMSVITSLKAPLTSLFPSLQLGPVETVFDMAYLLDTCKVPIDDVYKQVRGTSQAPTTATVPVRQEHAVLQAIRERVAANSKPGARTDKFKIALSIEGGGMRGSVSAGANSQNSGS